MEEKTRIEELEKALAKAQKQIESLHRKLDKQKQATKDVRKEVKKKDLKSHHFSEKEKEAISLVFPDTDLSKLP